MYIKEEPSFSTWNNHEMSNFKVTQILEALSRKGAELRQMLLLNTNRKSYVVRPTDLTLIDLDRSKSWSLTDCEVVYLVKEQSWAILFCFETNRKSHIGNPTAPLHLTLRDFERSKSRPLAFKW